MKATFNIYPWERIFNIFLFLLSSILCISNSICFYAWYLAAKQIGWVPEGSSIYDPHSMNWSSSFWYVIDNAITISFFSVLLISIISLISYFNNQISINKSVNVFAWISILLFVVLVLGGFVSWWFD